MTRLRAACSVLAGGLLLLVGFAGDGRAQTDPFVGYDFNADADAIGFSGGSAGSQGYPQTVSQTAHAETRVNTGPNSAALASAEWPGQFLANLGSLVQAFGAPEESNNLNYPVRAQAQSSGPTEADSPGASARAEGGEANATAQVDGFGGSDVITFGDARATTRSALEGAVGVSSAETIVSDISIGGVITIDSVITRAGASTDGVDGTATGETIVSGVEVAGQPAVVDENGVRFADSQNPSPADALRQQAIDDALANFSDGFTVDMFVSEPQVRNEGPVQEYRSGSLVIRMTAGDPSGDGGDGTFIIGGSNAYVQAAPAISFDQPTPLPPPTTAAPATPSTPPATTGSLGAPAPPATSAPPVTAAPEVAAPPPATSTFTPTLTEIARFGGIPFAMPFFILLGSLLIGRGLHRFHGAIVNAPPGTACIDDTGNRP